MYYEFPIDYDNAFVPRALAIVHTEPLNPEYLHLILKDDFRNGLLEFPLELMQCSRRGLESVFEWTFEHHFQSCRFSYWHWVLECAPDTHSTISAVRLVPNHDIPMRPLTWERCHWHQSLSIFSSNLIRGAMVSARPTRFCWKLNSHFFFSGREDQVECLHDNCYFVPLCPNLDWRHTAVWGVHNYRFHVEMTFAENVDPTVWYVCMGNWCMIANTVCTIYPASDGNIQLDLDLFEWHRNIQFPLIWTLLREPSWTFNIVWDRAHERTIQRGRRLLKRAMCVLPTATINTIPQDQFDAMWARQIRMYLLAFACIRRKRIPIELNWRILEYIAADLFCDE